MKHTIPQRLSQGKGTWNQKGSNYKVIFFIEGIRKAFVFFFSMSLYPFHGTIDVMSDDPMTIELPFKNFVLTDQARGRIREQIVKFVKGF